MQNYFHLNSSRTLAVLLLSIHAIALLALLLLPVLIWAKGAALFCLLFSLAYCLRRHAWLSLPGSCVAFRLEKLHIVLIGRDGRQTVGRVLGDSVVTPFAAILRVLPENAHFARSVVIFPDAIAAESFRTLRVALRWS